MPTLLLEWEESFGGRPPAWLARFIDASDDRPRELLRLLAGATSAEPGGARDIDEVLSEVLAGLPPDSDIVSAIDNAAEDLLASIDLGIPGFDSDALLSEALFRLFRVAEQASDRLLKLAADINQRVESGSYLTLRGSPTQDLAAEALGVAARNQHDDRFVPLWWRLCQLDSAIPEYSLIGLLGLRWSPSSVDDSARLLTEALLQLAEACVQASADELISDSRSRRLFLNAARTSMRSRADIDWNAVGTQLVDAARTPAARGLLARAFGLEPSDRGGPDQRASRGPYGDPSRARTIASSLERDTPQARREAEQFLDGQRTEASRQGDALPLVQSLCYFAHSVHIHAPDLAISWASEAARWQPHNHYTVVTWAEALIAADRGVDAVDLLLTRLHLLAEHAPMWVETGVRLEDLGEVFAAEEALREAVARFPESVPAWGALGEHLVRTHRPEDGLQAFETGLSIDPAQRYLLPGYARALALVGRRTEAEAALARAAEVLGPHSTLVSRRQRELESGDIDVRAIPTSPPGWPSNLSSEALGALGVLLRRTAGRRTATGVAPGGPSARHRLVLDELQQRADLSLTATSELAFSGALNGRHALAPSIRELIRVRAARLSLANDVYTQENLDELLFEGERSGIGDQRIVPLRELSRLRAAATLVDGAAIADEAASALRVLHRLGSMHDRTRSANGDGRLLTVGQRRSAWASTALAILGSGSTSPSLAVSIQAVPDQRHELDALEEDAAIGLPT